jgi:hypothetical protein
MVSSLIKFWSCRRHPQSWPRLTCKRRLPHYESSLLLRIRRWDNNIGREMAIWNHHLKCSKPPKCSPSAVHTESYAVLYIINRLQTLLQISMSFVDSWKVLAESSQSSLPSQMMSALIFGGRHR